MKHVLSGAAIAAALVIGAPILAHSAPMSPSGEPAAAAKAPHQVHKAARHRPHRQALRQTHRQARNPAAGTTVAGDEETRRLNQQELQRIESGETGAPPPAGMAPAGMAPGAPPAGAMGPPPPPSGEMPQ